MWARECFIARGPVAAGLPGRLPEPRAFPDVFSRDGSLAGSPGGPDLVGRGPACCRCRPGQTDPGSGAPVSVSRSVGEVSAEVVGRTRLPLARRVDLCPAVAAAAGAGPQQAAHPAPCSAHQPGAARRAAETGAGLADRFGRLHRGHCHPVHHPHQARYLPDRRCPGPDRQTPARGLARQHHHPRHPGRPRQARHPHLHPPAGLASPESSRACTDTPASRGSGTSRPSGRPRRCYGCGRGRHPGRR
jgi:hypothetical protein